MQGVLAHEGLRHNRLVLSIDLALLCIGDVWNLLLTSDSNIGKRSHFLDFCLDDAAVIDLVLDAIHLLVVVAGDRVAVSEWILVEVNFDGWILGCCPRRALGRDFLVNISGSFVSWTSIGRIWITFTHGGGAHAALNFATHLESLNSWLGSQITSRLPCFLDLLGRSPSLAGISTTSFVLERLHSKGRFGLFVFLLLVVWIVSVRVHDDVLEGFSVVSGLDEVLLVGNQGDAHMLIRVLSDFVKPLS